MATEPQTAEQADDEFAKMFSDFAKTENAADAAAAAAKIAEAKAVETPVADTAPVAETEIEGAPEPVAKTVAEKTVATPPVAAAEKTAEEIAAEAKAAADAAAEAAKAKPDPIERLADLITQRQPAPQEKTVEQPRPQPAPQVYDSNEIAALQEFYKDWPEAARGVELVVKGAVQHVTSHIFGQIAAVLGPKLQLLDALADNTQYGEITKAVPDYDKVRDEVVKWVDTQPTYLKSAFSSVMSEGTPEEIADLVGRYRQATGTTQKVATPPPVAETLSPAAKKAVAALAPVITKRTAPAQGTPATFEDAFDQFAKTIT